MAGAVPASARKGLSSSASSSASDLSTAGSAWWESTCVSPWEVLHATGHAFGQRAAHPGGGEARYCVGVFGEAAFGDHRVGRVVVHVQHWREVPVDAQAAQAAGHVGTHLFCQGFVAGRAQRHRGGGLRQKGGAHHRAAFLVDADQRVGPHRFPQVGGEAAHLGITAQVLAEQAHRAHLVLADEGGGVGIEGLARDVDHHEPAGVEVEAHQCVRVTLARCRGLSGSSPRACASASTIG